MGLLRNEVFVCLDCETTGLEPEKDQIIEIAIVVFTLEGILDSYETLINPGCLIPESSIAIHHITDEMVVGKPKIEEVMPRLLKMIDKYIVIGHGIMMDLTFIMNAAKKHQIPCNLHEQVHVDTLRLARLYGESPTNSLQQLRAHFNIEAEGAHRAMGDVTVNIEVFRHLSSQFKTTQELLERLKRPIAMRAMPLGKHKGRPFSEIPLEYLVWAAHKNFDQDLLFSIRQEIKKRKRGNQFEQVASPFSHL